MSDVAERLRTRIIASCAEWRITSNDLARRAGVSRETVGFMRSRKKVTKYATLESLYRACTAIIQERRRAIGEG